jgi:large subunit ribosomal protein L16
MLQPKQTKFRKMHKGRNRGLAQSGNTIAFGEFALKATTRGRITARQIESARRAMTRSIKRREAFKLAAAKLPVRTTFIKKAL